MNLKGNLTSKGLQGSIGKSRMQGILWTNPAAIPITVDNALSLSSTNPVQNKVITAAITNRLLSDEVKDALLQIVEKVAFIDEHGQDYYDALYDALYPPTNLDSIGAVFDSSATIYNTDTLDDLKQYLTVTAFYSDGTSETVTTYTLSGSMDAGTQTITVSYGGKTTTFTVTIIALDVESIDAVFTQGSAVIYTTDSLDTLRQYLVVTATYSDSTTAVVTDYTLSGTLGEGTSTITVSYGGKTDTFTVDCAVAGWLYHFNQSLASSGANDFGFTGDEQYTTGVNGYAYWHNVATEGTSSTDPGAITATSISPVPDFSSDFTLAYWFKDITPNRATVVAAYNVYSSASTSYSTTGFGAGTIDAQGWSLANSNLTKKQRGIRIRVIASGGIDLLLSDTGNTNGRIYNLTYPSAFDTTAWHHYALTRKNNVMYFFVDGVQIMHATVSASIKFGSKIALGSYWDIESSSGALVQTGYGSCFDDFYVSDFCKWDAAFDPSTIVY